MKISRIILSLLAISFSTKTYATGATVSFSGGAAIPTLSSTMLIVLSLLLFLVAFRVSKQKNNAAGKILITLLGVSAIITMGHSVKVISDTYAGSSINISPVSPAVRIEAGQDLDFISPDNQDVFMTITVDEGSQCIFAASGDLCVPANLAGDLRFTGTINTVNPAGSACLIVCEDPDAVPPVVTRPAAKRVRTR